MAVRSKPAHLAPAVFFVMFPLSFITTFLLALKNRHVQLIIPYISDTGDKVPDSCVFAMLFSLCSVVLVLSVYTRHLQISQHGRNSRRDRDVALWNDVASGFGVISSAGLLLVANFQESNLYTVHYTGAVLCICGGVIYFIFQTLISYLMRERLTSQLLLYIRVFLTSWAVLFLIIGIVSTEEAIEHPPEPENSTAMPRWDSSDMFWLAHVLSTSSEWILAVIQSCIVLSFVPELRTLKIVFPKLTVEKDLLGGSEPPTNHVSQAPHIPEGEAQE